MKPFTYVRPTDAGSAVAAVAAEGLTGGRRAELDDTAAGSVLVPGGGGTTL